MAHCVPHRRAGQHRRRRRRPRVAAGAEVSEHLGRRQGFGIDRYLVDAAAQRRPVVVANQQPVGIRNRVECATQVLAAERAAVEVHGQGGAAVVGRNDLMPQPILDRVRGCKGVPFVVQGHRDRVRRHYIMIGPLLVVFTHASTVRGALAVGSPGPGIDWRTEPPAKLTAGSLSLGRPLTAPWVNAPP